MTIFYYYYYSIKINKSKFYFLPFRNYSEAFYSHFISHSDHEHLNILFMFPSQFMMLNRLKFNEFYTN